MTCQVHTHARVRARARAGTKDLITFRSFIIQFLNFLLLQFTMNNLIAVKNHNDLQNTSSA